jgi:ABC-type Fe3+-hydroxamate transport system substrate-binding protein
MLRYIDQLGHHVEISSPPKRIISIVPSITELLSDLGLDNEIVGITKFCVHPDAWFRSKTRIGGTKSVHVDQIRALQPDLILANKEENLQEQVNELAKYSPVWISDISNLEEALQMISAIGEITETTSKSVELISSIREKFQLLPLKNTRPIKTAYLIWQKPFMTVGADTFIHDMMNYCGFENIFSNRTRYPETSIEELQSLDIELLLLSSEPFPFQQKHVDELHEYLPQTKILLVDGEMFSWYGSRLLLAADYFKSLQAL